MKNSIAEHLYELTKLIDLKIREHKSKKLVNIANVPYIRHTVTSFKYEEGLKGISISSPVFTRKEWNETSQLNFINDVIKKDDLYIRTCKIIARDYKVKLTDADQNLFTFVKKITFQVYKHKSHKVILNAITIFISDLEKTPINFNIKVWVIGFWLDENEATLNGSIKLRKVMPRDFESVSRYYSYNTNTLHAIMFSTSIISLNMLVPDISHIHKEVNLLIGLLRLFKLGSVQQLKIEVNSGSFLRNYKFGESDISKFSFYKYKVSSKDSYYLNSFYKKIRENYKKVIDEVNSANPVKIAINRYEDGIINDYILEKRITSAITSLEALFLRAEERVELSHRLAQRVAKTLSYFKLSPNEIYKNIKRAYEIRSTFIHGSYYEKKGDINMNTLAESVLEFARISILLFLQFENLNKEGLISKIDNALINDDAAKKLKTFFSSKSIFYK